MRELKEVDGALKGNCTTEKLRELEAQLALLEQAAKQRRAFQARIGLKEMEQYERGYVRGLHIARKTVEVFIEAEFTKLRNRKGVTHAIL